MRTAFRLVGWLEALSFLVLLGVAMPMKYVWEIREATQIPGLAHGILFVLYVAFATVCAIEEDWPRRRLGWAYAASVAPLGTLIFDHHFLAPR